MPTKVVPLIEHDLFVRSEARQEALLRNAYARQEARGHEAQRLPNTPAVLIQPVLSDAQQRLGSASAQRSDRTR